MVMGRSNMTPGSDKSRFRSVSEAWRMAVFCVAVVEASPLTTEPFRNDATERSSNVTTDEERGITEDSFLLEGLAILKIYCDERDAVVVRLWSSKDQ